MSEPAVSYAFEELEPSDPPPRDAPARLLAEANAEAEHIRERAREEGYAEGHAAGRADGAEALAAAITALGEAVEGVQALAGEVAVAVERDAIELALALAEKVLAASLKARPELVVDVVQGALRRVADRRRITVLVNPRDLEIVEAAIGDPASGIARQGHGSAIELFDLQGEERVGIGGAIVRTAEGEVDASVQTQLDRAREVVLAELSGGEQAA